MLQNGLLPMFNEFILSNYVPLSQMLNAGDMYKHDLRILLLNIWIIENGKEWGKSYSSNNGLTSWQFQQILCPVQSCAMEYMGFLFDISLISLKM